MTSPRMSRTKLGTKTMAMATATLLRLAPRRAATVRARTSGGKENRASITRMVTESTQPRRKPANSPRGSATTMARATISKVARSETRPPQMIRLRMSRPRSSVPRRWWRLGPASMASRSWALGSCGATSGAKMAATIMTTRNPRPATAQWSREEGPPEPAGPARAVDHLGRRRPGRGGRADQRVVGARRGQRGHASRTFGIEEAVDHVDHQVDQRRTSRR